MWVWGMGVGLVIFVAGSLLSIFAFLDASGLDGMLPGIVLAAVGSATFFGFLLWGLVRQRSTRGE